MIPVPCLPTVFMPVFGKGGSAVQHIRLMMALTSHDEPGVYVCQLA